MITVRINRYCKEEVDLLEQFLLKFTQGKCEQIVDCKQCKYKHVCGDIFRVLEFIRKEQENGYPTVKN